MIRPYYALTKPGIVLGNLITATSGAALASKGHMNYQILLWTLLGLSLVMASACAFNNYIDRKSDEKMTRTKNRPLVKGVISARNAILFASILILLGLFVLFHFTNLLTVWVATGGFFVYVVLYSIWKYRSVHGTVIGSVAGGVPPVVGYCAVSNHFDMGALLLFLIVVLWQMPHFFSIAMYRLDDYIAAAIPVLPVKRGAHRTKVQMLLYIIFFMIAAWMLLAFGYAGYFYLAVSTLLGGIWIWLCMKGFKSKNDQLWARQMFRFSLVTIVLLSIMISIDGRV